MGEAMRGSRLGATSYETDLGVELAPRLWTTYDCPNGHSFDVPFSVEAEVPYTWECRFCQAIAVQRDGHEPEAQSKRHQRTPWDMLLERRTMDDLESLLDERLTLLRDRGGVGVVLHEARAMSEERGRRRGKVPSPRTGTHDRKSA
jgi:hypothetical protein